MTQSDNDKGHGLDKDVLSVDGFDRLLNAFSSDSQKIADVQREAALAKQELSRIAQLILAVDSRCISDDPAKELDSRNAQRSRLAAQLGCTAGDLQDIVDSYGDRWQELMLEERVRHGIDSTQMRDVTWDRLESAVLRKLMLVVDNMKTTLSVAEMVAIAKTANTAVRGERRPATTPQSGLHVSQTNNYIGGDPANGVLPAGNLGRISLNLSDRVLKQIEGTVVRPAEATRVIDSIDMMNIKEIQAAGEEEDESK